MNHILSLILHHGYLVIFLIVLAEAVGMPVPSALALIAGGAAMASGSLRGPTVAMLAIAAMLLGDTLLLPSRQPYGMAFVGVSLPGFSQPGNMHPSRRGIVL